MTDLESLYRERFSAVERQRKDEIWRVLCQDFFQQFVRPDQDTVLDIACGLGEFTRHIKARRKVAVDLNPEAASLLPPGVAFHLASAEHMALVETGSIDVCFSSNFLEHLPSKDAVTRVLAEVRRVLRPGGLYVALQPNIRLCPDVYWDFADHHTALSDRSCREMFLQSGLAVTRLIPRFLPFSTKSSLPNHPALVRAYLRVPLAWRIMGKQFLIVGKNDPVEAAGTHFRGGAELVPPRSLTPGAVAQAAPGGEVLPNV